MTHPNGNFFRDLSLKTKTLVFIALVTAVPVGLLMWALLTSFTQASIDVEGKALSQTAGLIRQELLDSVDAKAKIYDLTFKNLIIGLETVKDEAADPDSRQKELAALASRNHDVAAAYFIPAERLGGDAPALPDGFAFVEDGQRVYTGRWFGPYQDATTPSPAIVYGLPVWSDDGLTGVLAFDITVDTLLNEVIDIDPSQTSYVVLARNDGTVITASREFPADFDIRPPGSTNILQSSFVDRLDLRRVIAGRDESRGSFELPVEAGPGKVVTYANIPSFGARILVVSPLDELLQVQKEKVSQIRAAVQHIALLGLLALLTLGLLIGGAVYVFSENAVIKPLRRLMKGVVSLERANFEQGTDVPVTSNDEIGSLASRFNGMAAMLRESYEGLERKVEERTAEIQRNLTEIERLNRFMVGRELRMRELKDELAKLRGEPPKKD